MQQYPSIAKTMNGKAPYIIPQPRQNIFFENILAKRSGRRKRRGVRLCRMPAKRVLPRRKKRVRIVPLQYYSTFLRKMIPFPHNFAKNREGTWRSAKRRGNRPAGAVRFTSAPSPRGKAMRPSSVRLVPRLPPSPEGEGLERSRSGSSPLCVIPRNEMTRNLLEFCLPIQTE